MAKDYARRFYSSKRWQDTRNAYAKSKHHLCERCLAQGLFSPGEIVHHREHLTPTTIENPEIALSWDNLELLCRRCHAEEHGQTFDQLNERKREERQQRRRFFVDENGAVHAAEAPPFSQKKRHGSRP